VGIFVKRLPQRQDILYVFGGVVFIVYSWALRGFLYQLSSFIVFHPLGEIAGILAYMMALALLESVLVMVGLVSLAFILPRKWFLDGFVYKAFLAALVAGIASLGVQQFLTEKKAAIEFLSAGVELAQTRQAREYLNQLLYAGAGIAVTILTALILFFEHMPRLQKILLNVIERLQVFLYLYIPIGMLSLLVIFIRNLG
jgi:hypothetical protein